MEVALTLVRVASGALVCLDTIGTLIETLVAAGNSNTLVTSEVPTAAQSVFIPVIVGAGGGTHVCW